MLLPLLLRCSSIARERMDFVNEVAAFLRLCICEHGMTCGWWICNTRGLTICLIQDFYLCINHTNDQKVCQVYCLYAGDLYCGLGVKHVAYVKSLYGFVQTWSTSIFPQFLEILTSVENYLWLLPRLFPSFFMFGEIWLYAYHMFILWLPARKQAHFLKYFGFLIFTIFCVWNYCNENLCQIYVCFFRLLLC